MTARATVSYAVDFGKPPRTDAVPVRAGRVLRVARLLAFAHQIEGRVRYGEYRDLADAARKLGITRARVTQIVNLTMLAPEIQEAILTWPAISFGTDTSVFSVPGTLLRLLTEMPSSSPDFGWRAMMSIPVWSTRAHS